MCVCVYMKNCMVYKHQSSLWSWPEQDRFFGFSPLQKVSLNIQYYLDSAIRHPATVANLILWTVKSPRLHPAPMLPQLALVPQASLGSY